MECRHYKGGRRVWCPPGCPWQGDPRPGSWRARRGWQREHRGEDGRFGLDEGFHTLEELWIPEVEHWLHSHGRGLDSPVPGLPGLPLPLERRPRRPIPASSPRLPVERHRPSLDRADGSTRMAVPVPRRGARGREAGARGAWATRVLPLTVSAVLAIGLAVSSLVLAAGGGPSGASGPLASSTPPAASRTVRTEVAQSVPSMDDPGAGAPGHCPGAGLHQRRLVAARARRVHLVPAIRPADRLSLVTTRSHHRPCRLVGLRHRHHSAAVS
jgi:hypothetical protein